MKVLIPMAGLIDKAEEMARLGKDIEKREKDLQRVEAKLGNEKFTSRAPADVVEKERQKMEDMRTSLQSLKEQLNSISKI